MAGGGWCRGCIAAGQAAPAGASTLTAEAAVQHARKPETVVPAAVPGAGAEASEEERWPPGRRVMFMIGAAVVCWAVILLAGWWLFG